MKYISTLPALLLGSLLLAGCNNTSTDNSNDGIGSKISANIESEINKAKAEFEKERKDIEVRLKDGKQAMISANGDLNIAGEKIDLTPAQRELTLQYYNTTREMAMQGMEIGKESAKLATQAIGSAISGAIKGDPEAEIEKSIEAKAGNIEAVAMKLCDTALQLKKNQAELMAAVPEFKPEPMTVDKHDDGCSMDNGFIHGSGGKDDKALSEAEVRQ